MDQKKIAGLSKTILDDVAKVLTKNSVKFSASQAEIVIKDRKKKEICGLISSLPIDACTLKCLLDVVEAKKKLYIRKRIKKD